MSRRINAEGLEKLKKWEGFVPYTYDDADPSTPKRRGLKKEQFRGTPTIGYGHTGPDVVPGMIIDEKHACVLLQGDLARFEARVEKLVKVPLTDNQFAALVSFDFNTGALDQSTLLKELNKGNYHNVPFELAKWNKTTIAGKKVVSEGLANRRAVEAALWAKGSFVSGQNVPVAVPSKPVVTLQSASLAVPVIAGVGSAIGDAGPLFSGAGPVQWALAALVVIGALVGAVIFVNKHLKRG